MGDIDAIIKRNIDSNQLVIKCDNVDYRLKMLEANKIPGLLPLFIKENDGHKVLYYDITSKECFAGLVAVRTMKLEDIRSFIYCLSRIIVNIEAYLLNPEDLILDKDYIYVRGEDMEPTLCYLPGYDGDFNSKLSLLLQDMLGMVDHNDHDAVVLAYSLYQESLRPGYVMKDLIRILNGEISKDKKTGNRSGNKNGIKNGMEPGRDNYNGTGFENEQENVVRSDNGIEYVVASQEDVPVLTQSEYESLYDAMNINSGGLNSSGLNSGGFSSDGFGSADINSRNEEQNNKSDKGLSRGKDGRSDRGLFEKFPEKSHKRKRGIMFNL